MNKLEEYKSKVKYDLWLDVTKVKNEKEKAATRTRLKNDRGKDYEQPTFKD